MDYETRTTYMVTLTAEDSFSESDSIAVTIMVTDMDEMPNVTGDDNFDYAENGTGAVGTFTATDPERTSVSWSLAGTDANAFNIARGVLTFKKSPDFEALDQDNMYEVTVKASDSTRMAGEKPITVKVTNMDEPGKVTLSARRPQFGVEFTATATDPDGHR